MRLFFICVVSAETSYSFHLYSDWASLFFLTKEFFLEIKMPVRLLMVQGRLTHWLGNINSLLYVVVKTQKTNCVKTGYICRNIMIPGDHGHFIELLIYVC